MSGHTGSEGLLEARPQILDACCGGRMWWWDKAHPLAVYMDKREAPRGSVGEVSGRPEWNPNWTCEPDTVGDFRAIPFPDGAFQQVVFDPPHIVREKQPPEGINGLKYGALHPESEQDELRQGFAECWRVLAPGGTLVFKWAGSLDRVEPHFPATPTVGSRNAPRGSKGLGTRWFIFYKPLLSVHPMVTNGVICAWCHRNPKELAAWRASRSIGSGCRGTSVAANGLQSEPRVVNDWLQPEEAKTISDVLISVWRDAEANGDDATVEAVKAALDHLELPWVSL